MSLIFWGLGICEATSTKNSLVGFPSFHEECNITESAKYNTIHHNTVTHYAQGLDGSRTPLVTLACCEILWVSQCFQRLKMFQIIHSDEIIQH